MGCPRHKRSAGCRKHRGTIRAFAPAPVVLASAPAALTINHYNSSVSAPRWFAMARLPRKPLSKRRGRWTYGRCLRAQGASPHASRRWNSIPADRLHCIAQTTFPRGRHFATKYGGDWQSGWGMPAMPPRLSEKALCRWVFPARLRSLRR